MGAWFGIDLWKRVILGLVLGLAVGLAFRYGMGAEAGGAFVTTWIYPVGEAFVRLIRMLIVPLIFTTLVAGVTAMGDPKRLGSLGGRTLSLYIATTAFAVTFGLIVGTIVLRFLNLASEDLAPSADDLASIEGRIEAAGAAGGIVDRLLAIIPANPAEALASADVLGIIFFAIIFGVGCLLAGDKGAPVARMIESGAEAMLKVTIIVMETAPFGVFALMSWVMATKGLGVLASLGLLTFALYLTCFLHIVLVYGGLIKGVLRLPLIPFFRGIADAQAVAYSTASSSATLPVTITCANENLGIRKAVASSVLPLGATINMDGTAIYLGLVALFAANVLSIEMTPGLYLLVALTATLSSIGAAGIPSAGLLLATVVLSAINVDETFAIGLIAFIFPFDRLLDMMRTLTNVTGDAAVATAVAKWEGELDEAVYRARDRV